MIYKEKSKLCLSFFGITISSGLMPSTSIPLSHSVICSNSAPKGWHLLYRLTE